MADANKEPAELDATAKSEDSIIDMTDEQILALVNHYYDMYQDGILDFDNEADISNEALVDVVAGLTYLIESGAMPKADEVFGDFWKLAWTELHGRMGNTFFGNTANEDALPITNELEGESDPTLTEPADATDVAVGDYQPELEPDLKKEADVKEKPEEK